MGAEALAVPYNLWKEYKTIEEERNLKLDAQSGFRGIVS